MYVHATRTYPVFVLLPRADPKLRHLFSFADRGAESIDGSPPVLAARGLEPLMDDAGAQPCRSVLAFVHVPPSLRLRFEGPSSPARKVIDLNRFPAPKRPRKHSFLSSLYPAVFYPSIELNASNPLFNSSFRISPSSSISLVERYLEQAQQS